MAKYKYVNVTYGGKSMHFGVMLMSEVRKFADPNDIRDILEKRYPDKIIFVDIADNDLFVIGPSNPEDKPITTMFYQDVDLRDFREHWIEDTIQD